MEFSEIGLTLGIFLGNWLVVPLLFESRSFKDGFFTGLIAAGLCSIFFIVC